MKANKEISVFAFLKALSCYCAARMENIIYGEWRILENGMMGYLVVWTFGRKNSLTA